MLEGDALIKEMLSCFHTARLDTIFSHIYLLVRYSHHSNNRGGWNKRGGGAKVAKSIKVEVGINMEGGIFWYTNAINLEWRVEKNLRNQ